MNEVVARIVRDDEAAGSNPVFPTIWKHHCNLNPRGLDNNGVFVINPVFKWFFEAFFIFVIWTKKKENANFKMEKLKVNVYEPVSLFTYSRISSCLKAYSLSFCSGVLYCSFYAVALYYRRLYTCLPYHETPFPICILFGIVPLFMEEKNGSITELSYGT